MKFQSIAAPDGMIIHLDGPYAGARHDSYLLSKSHLLDEIFPRHLRNFVVYGDPAYGINDYIISGYQGANLSELKQEFNKRMSKVRECVEWEFKEVVVRLWAFLDFSKNLKLWLSPIGKYYIVGIIMKNVFNCYNPSQTSRYFNCPPPLVYDYLHSFPMPEE